MFNRHNVRSLSAVALAVGTAWTLVALPALAASTQPGKPESRNEGVVDRDALAAEIRKSVRDAVRIDHDALAAQIRDSVNAAMDASQMAIDTSQMLAQIDLDEAMLDAPTLAYIAGELGGGRAIVKNAPYTADAVTESVQTFSDGNRIVRRSSTSLARDGMGRTRQEKKRERGSSVYVYDPIEGKSFALNTERKTAVRIPRVPMHPMPPIAPTPPTPPMPPTPPSSPEVHGTVSMAASATKVQAGPNEVDVQPGRVIVRKKGEGDAGDEVRVEVIRVERDAASAQRHEMLPLPSFSLPLMPRGRGETQSLGSREFDGVRADGTRTTHTIAAGAIGNEKPIVISTERWFSPELNLVVYAKTSDPRAGETIYRLTNIKRGEPPRELFRVPDDYRVRGEPKPK